MNLEYTITAILGTMFAGKTTRLIQELNKLKVAGYEIDLFKPKIDNRYDNEKVSTHDKITFKAIPVKNYAELEKKYNSEKKVLSIDEIQFFESDVLKLLEQHANKGGIVIVSGLTKDFKDDYFKFKDKKYDMSELIRIADNKIFLQAICTYKKENGEVCGKGANHVQRFINNKVAPLDSELVLIGGKECYEARCREHYHFYNEDKENKR